MKNVSSRFYSCERVAMVSWRHRLHIIDHGNDHGQRKSLQDCVRKWPSFSNTPLPMKIFKGPTIRLSMVFMFLSFFDKFADSDCQCGSNILSQSLFLDILNDQKCDFESDCVIDGDVIDAGTYNSTKAYNCSAECFSFFGSPSPSLDITALPPSAPANDFPHQALIAIVIGSVAFVLCIICGFSCWQRKRRRTKKVLNKTLASQIDVVMQTDLQNMIQLDIPASSNDIKHTMHTETKDCLDFEQAATMSVQQNGGASHAAECNTYVEYEKDEPLNATNARQVVIQVESHPVELDDLHVQDDPEHADKAFGEKSDIESANRTALSQYLQAQGFMTSFRQNKMQ